MYLIIRAAPLISWWILTGCGIWMITWVPGTWKVLAGFIATICLYCGIISLIDYLEEILIKNRQRHRMVMLWMGEDDFNALRELQEMTDAESISEVIRRALNTYYSLARVLCEAREKAQSCAQDENGEDNDSN